MWLTMPNPEGRKASLTLFISLAWVGLLSYFASWWLVTFCCAYSLSTFMFGIIVVPWMIAFREFEHFRQISKYFGELSQRGIRAHNAKFGKGFRFEEQQQGDRINFTGRFQGESFENGPQRMLKPTLSDLKIGLYESYPAMIMQITLGLGLIWLIYTIFIKSPLELGGVATDLHFLLLLGLVWVKLVMGMVSSCVVGKISAVTLIVLYFVYGSITVLLEEKVITL